MRDRVRLPEANMMMYMRGVAIDLTCTCLAEIMCVGSFPITKSIFYNFGGQ